MTNSKEPAISAFGDDDQPFTCVKCGNRTDNAGVPQKDDAGETFIAERCRGCDQLHHFYESPAGEALEYGM